MRTTCLLNARWSLLPTSTLGMPGACSSTSFTHLQKKGHLATLGAANESAEWATGLMIRIKRRPVHALEAPLVGDVVNQEDALCPTTVAPVCSIMTTHSTSTADQYLMMVQNLPWPEVSHSCSFTLLPSIRMMVVL